MTVQPIAETDAAIFNYSPHDAWHVQYLHDDASETTREGTAFRDYSKYTRKSNAFRRCSARHAVTHVQWWISVENGYVL